MNSSRSNVLANQPRSSPMRSGSISRTPGSGVGRNLTARLCAVPHGSPAAQGGPSREESQLRRARGELPAPLADEAQLLHDLVLEVPRQDQHDIGLFLADRLGRADRDVAAGQEVPLLVGVQIAGVVDEVGAHTTVVEQRVALRGCAVAHDAAPLLLQADEEAEYLALVGLHAPAVAEVGLELLVACGALALGELACGVGLDLGGVLLVTAVDPQRAPVRGQLLDVEQAQAVGLEDAAYGQEGEIGEVLVVDGVPLVVLHEAHEMGELHRDHATWLQQDLHSANEVAEGPGGERTGGGGAEDRGGSATGPTPRRPAPSLERLLSRGAEVGSRAGAGPGTPACEPTPPTPLQTPPPGPQRLRW